MFFVFNFSRVICAHVSRTCWYHIWNFKIFFYRSKNPLNLYLCCLFTAFSCLRTCSPAEWVSSPSPSPTEPPSSASSTSSGPRWTSGWMRFVPSRALPRCVWAKKPRWDRSSPSLSGSDSQWGGGWWDLWLRWRRWRSTRRGRRSRSGECCW